MCRSTLQPWTSDSTRSATSCRDSAMRGIDNSARRNGSVTLCSQGIYAMHPSRASILVVEDDPAVARALMDALEMTDYRVWHAVDGHDAQGQLERAQPDLVLLDLMLPDIDGLVLCSRLKSVAEVPIIICS